VGSPAEATDDSGCRRVPVGEDELEWAWQRFQAPSSDELADLDRVEIHTVTALDE
jgi:hypothetical protein